MSNRIVSLPPGTPVEEARVLHAASNNEDASREQVQALLESKPEWIARIGTLAAVAEASILGVGKNQVIGEETARAELKALRLSLVQPRDGALEDLLIERIALSWAALMGAESSRALHWSEGVSPQKADLLDRHVERLNAGFLQAARTLATVRRLRLPGVQVNIAEQQVNVAR